MKLLILLAISICGFSSESKPLIPRGLHVFQEVEGDLNNDGLIDNVRILSECKDEDECGQWAGDSDPQIILAISLARDKREYKEAISSNKAICFKCLGTRGGAIGGRISISPKGLVQLNYFGGSRFTYSQKLIFKWNDDDFNLIGSTWREVDSDLPKGSDKNQDFAGKILISDINYSTRKVVVTKLNNKLKKVTRTCSLQADFVAPEIKTFEFESFDDGSDHCKN